MRRVARAGGAHFGLQWHPDHPGGTAVNWGGYDRSGSILPGSASDLPSALHNDNTRDLAWVPRRPYRLRISRSTDPAPVDGLVSWQRLDHRPHHLDHDRGP